MFINNWENNCSPLFYMLRLINAISPCLLNNNWEMAKNDQDRFVPLTVSSASCRCACLTRLLKDFYKDFRGTFFKYVPVSRNTWECDQQQASMEVIAHDLLVLMVFQCFSWDDEMEQNASGMG